MKYNHDFFTDENIEHKINLGIAVFIKGVFHVKCYGCYELLPADTEHFHINNRRCGKDRIKTRCKACIIIPSKDKLINIGG